VYIVTIGEILTVVPTAAFFAAECGASNEPPDGDQACRSPIVGVQDAAGPEGRIQFLPGGLEQRQGARQTLAISEQADVVPHQTRQLDRIDLESNRLTGGRHQ
jgi:hypothetical protein